MNAGPVFIVILSALALIALAAGAVGDALSKELPQTARDFKGFGSTVLGIVLPVVALFVVLLILWAYASSR